MRGRCSGGIGQPLCMQLAMNDKISELCVYDLDLAPIPPKGVAADLGHLEFPAKVTPYVISVKDRPIDKLQECLTGCHLVLVPAGMPRKPGMNRSDLLGVNCNIAKGIVEACAKWCPNAILGLIVNPVNSVVPAMCELYKKKGLDHTKIIGVTTLDCVRANKFVAAITGDPVGSISIPVIGGHAGTTILPLFSQDGAGKKVPADKVAGLDERVQNAGTEVVNAKGSSATLSMAYAASRFAKAVLNGLSGQESVECAYVPSNIIEGMPYFSSKVTFGKTGVMKVHPIGPLNEHEKKRLEEMKKVLKGEVDDGIGWSAGQELNLNLGPVAKL